ncbi:MAG: helix-turn-helix domain-containing protein [Aphanothece sp. CMT-3BRIN-NPC111]|nr:helix-turn-helix domain-containing protein [Aphanothece sp. CMT-3BRIN-NPC111]
MTSTQPPLLAQHAGTARHSWNWGTAQLCWSHQKY